MRVFNVDLLDLGELRNMSQFEGPFFTGYVLQGDW